MEEVCERRYDTKRCGNDYLLINNGIRWGRCCARQEELAVAQGTQPGESAPECGELRQCDDEDGRI